MIRKSLIACLLITVSGCNPAAIESGLKKDIKYGRVGNMSLQLDASMPAGTGPYPVVIVLHGGGWSGGDKAMDLAPVLVPLTDGQFTWFSINYRLAPANRWPACYDDVRSAIRWVKLHAGDYKGDSQHIGLIGYSAGGHLVCLAATDSDPALAVEAVVGIAPPTDLELDLPQRGGLSKALQGLLGKPKEVSDDSRKLLHDMSAVNHIHAGMPPFLLIHGTADKSVPYQGSVTFSAKLRAADVPCELIAIKGAPHRLSDWEKFDPTFGSEMVAWLHTTLNTAKH